MQTAKLWLSGLFLFVMHIYYYNGFLGDVSVNCCITELRCKEVINKADGCRLGLVSDVEVDTCCGRVVALVIYGRPKYWGICGKRERIRVCWEDIEVIGSDTILVCKAQCDDSRRRR